MQNLAHSASLHFKENNAPSKLGIKYLGRLRTLKPIVPVESGIPKHALSRTILGTDGTCREHTRHIIHPCGIVVKSGVTDLSADDSAIIPGALI